MKQSFKTLYQTSQRNFPTNNLWENNIDFSEDQYENIELFIVNVQRLFQSDNIETYIEFEKAFLQDILNLKENYTEPIQVDFLNYLQLSTFNNSVGFFNVKGLFNYSYDSITYSVNDYELGYGEKLIIFNNRFWKFLISPNVHIQRNAEHLITDWFCQFYYCSYSSGALAGFGYDFWESAKELCLTPENFSLQKLRLLSSLISWNGQYKAESHFVVSDFLEVQFNKLDWSNDLKVEICQQLILIKEIPNNKRRKWYCELIKECELKGHSDLQLLVGILDDIKGFKKYFSRIFTALKTYNTFLKSKSTNSITIAYEKARIFKILNDLLLILGNKGKTTELTKILSLYYEINSKLESSILYIFPYFENGIVYSCNGKVRIHPQDSFNLAKDLILLSNQLFNRTVALIGDKDEIYVPKDIMGKPSSNYASHFESKIEELYNFNLIKENYSKNIKGILQLGFNSIPIQTMMLKKIGFTFPINSSISKPLNEPEIKKILIWTGASYTSYFEELTLKYLCEKYDIEFELIPAEEVSKDVFIEKYKSNNYSTLWIASHGEHKNFEPHKSLINISENEIITLEELVQNNPSNECNRLLVLNLCESGINSESGGFKGLGFGHQLVSNQQSIISHLWMVEPRIAMTFGIILAIGLIAYENSYFEAYEFAASNMLKGRTNIISLLEEEISELEDVIDRVKNTDNLDWENILNWGSAAFYQ